MSIKKRYPRGSARTLIDFTRLTDRLTNAGDVLICIPVGLLDIIRMLLKDRGLWRSTYAIAYDDVGYTSPDSTEFEPVQSTIEAFLEETNTMRCDDLLTSLNAIAEAIRSSSVGIPGNDQTYVSDGEGGVWFGSEAPVDKPTTFGGEGDAFATEAAFEEHLCEAANHIVSGMIMSLNNWSILSAASLMAGIVVAAVIVATPPLAVFIALLVLGFSFVATGNMAIDMDTRREDWVCAIYNATGYADMLVRVDSLISELVIDLDLGLFSVPITDLIHAMLSTDVLNTAYTAFGYPAPIDPIDCLACAEGNCVEELVYLEGELVSLTDNEDGTYILRVSSTYNSGLDQERINIESTYDINECTFYFHSMSKVSGPTCTRAGRYTRPDDTTTNLTDLPLNPEPNIGPIKKLEYWQSSSCSPGTSVYDIKVSMDGID